MTLGASSVIDIASGEVLNKRRRHNAALCLTESIVSLKTVRYI